MDLMMKQGNPRKMNQNPMRNMGGYHQNNMQCQNNMRYSNGGGYNPNYNNPNVMHCRNNYYQD